MPANLHWYEPEFKKKLDARLERNLNAVAVFLVGDIKDKFPDSGVQGASKKERQANRSKPGEIPHVQTGHLKNNIGYSKPEKLKRRVGTGIGGKQSVGYAAYLEFGTPNGQMKARPFLRPAIYRNRKKIEKMLALR